MHAPFRGRIAQRRVENFEEVLAKQTVFSLQNIKLLDVIINLPESVIRNIRGNVGDSSVGSNTGAAAVTATAQFEGREEIQIPLRLKELATKADEQTQTFRATLTMDAPTEFNVLPGMTATVVLDFTAVVSRGVVKWVPVRAVQADSGLEPLVWILDSESMTVTRREVSIGRLSGGSVEIKSGLQGGDEIVSVGAPYLAEGMRVTRMKKTEQAIPTDDPS
jgi:RND family efflux transporter MFP subunit